MNNQIRPKTDVISTELPNGEIVLLNLTTQQYFSLNATGATVWRMLQEQHRPDEIVLALQARYATDNHDVSEDIKRLIEQLIAAKMMEVSG